MDLLGGLFDGLRAAAENASPVAKSPAPPVDARTPSGGLARRESRVGEGQVDAVSGRPSSFPQARRPPSGGEINAVSQPHPSSSPHQMQSPSQRNDALGDRVWGDPRVTLPEEGTEGAGNVVVEALVTMGFDRRVAELAVCVPPPVVETQGKFPPKRSRMISQLW